MNHQMPLEDRERYEALRSLLENPGWKLMREYLEHQVREMEEFIMEGSGTSDQFQAMRGKRTIYKSLLNWPAEQRAAIEGRNKPTEKHG